MPADPSLNPVSGSPREVERLVARWLDADSAPPIGVRTSGSTGEPKDVLLSVAAMRSSATAALSRLGGPGQWLLALPAHRIAGLQVLVRSRLASTRPVVLGEYPDLADATRSMAGERSYVSLVPTQLERYLRDRAATDALNRFDAVLVGGSAASPELLERAHEATVPVVLTYGMTETCGGCVYDGHPLDEVKAAVDQDGLVRLAGPVLFDGYDGRPGLTAAVLRAGWLHTADLGSFDEDGRLRIWGRADDVVISGGVNVGLSAVERRLSSMPEVEQCGVVAVPDAEWGSRVAAAVVVVDGLSGPDISRVRNWVAAELPRSWAPREVLLLDRLPVSEDGKLDHRTVVALIQRQRVQADRQGDNPPETAVVADMKCSDTSRG